MTRKEAEQKRIPPNKIDKILEAILEAEEIDAYHHIIEYGMFNSDWLTFWRDNNITN